MVCAAGIYVYINSHYVSLCWDFFYYFFLQIVKAPVPDRSLLIKEIFVELQHLHFEWTDGKKKFLFMQKCKVGKF